ncbi:DUF111 family protein [bacterium]|nr:DUF111 family protein [bacterium]
MSDDLTIETLDLLQADLDDESPEVLAAACEALLAAGALDVVCLPMTMKKGRLGTRLEVLAQPQDSARLIRMMLTETSTLGVRRLPVERTAMARRFAEVEVFGESVRVKVALLDGKPLKAKPEFDDCRRIAGATGQPVRTVLAAAQEAIRRAGLLDGS